MLCCLLVCMCGWVSCGGDRGDWRQGGWWRRQRGGELLIPENQLNYLWVVHHIQRFLFPFLPSLVLMTRPFGIWWPEQTGRHLLVRSGPSSSCSASLVVDIGIAFITLCPTFEASRNRSFTIKPQWRESVLIVRRKQKQHIMGPKKCVLIKCQIQRVIWA